MPLIRICRLLILLACFTASCSAVPPAPPIAANVPVPTVDVAPAPSHPNPTQPGASDLSAPAAAAPTDRPCQTNDDDHVVAPSARGCQVLMDEALDFCQAAQEFWQKGDLDSALEALDQAYSLVLQADGETDPKMIQQKEDLRYLIAKRILEIYASRHIVVNGNHQAIPMVRNAHVDAEIQRLSGVERDFFIAALKRSGRYRPRIVAALHAAGLPEELSWLPLIESGFKVDAMSRARALGLWQFIQSTGNKFGLKRDVYIDERLDPEKATVAAIAYLKELHSIFGDWTTVLAAYNCGEGRVLRIIRDQNVNYLDNFWDLYERLPQETARYVPRFLATVYILQNRSRYGLKEIKPDPPLEYETIEISRRVALKDIATAIDSDEDLLRQLNPELRYRIVPGDEYPLKIPSGRADTLIAALDRIPAAAKPQRPFVYHRVKTGETLSTIARRYRTSIAAIMRTNNLRRSNLIVAGRSLKVPTRGYPAGPKRLPAPNPARDQTLRHVVKSGDSLWILAQRYGTTVHKIQAANNLAGTHLKIGQALAIPSGAAHLDAAPKLKSYHVQKGDTPFMIAKQHNMPLERLLRINRLSPRCTIYPGQTLQID